MPQFEVADAALLDPAKLSRIERGLCLTTPAEMQRILKVLGPRAASALHTAEQLIDLLDPENIEESRRHEPCVDVRRFNES